MVKHPRHPSHKPPIHYSSTQCVTYRSSTLSLLLISEISLGILMKLLIKDYGNWQFLVLLIQLFESSLFMLFIALWKRFFLSGNPMLAHVKIRFVSFQEISRKLNNKLTTELRKDFTRYNNSVSIKSTQFCTLEAHWYFKEQGISPRRSLLYHDEEISSSFVTTNKVTSYANVTTLVTKEMMNGCTSEANLALEIVRSMSKSIGTNKA